ncbi:MAG: TolC family protein [Flavobacterium sp.]|nr:TolC family protein [Candidatus Neoflavobacterium equi]
MNKINISSLALFLALVTGVKTAAQEREVIGLETVKQAAFEKNHLLKVKQYQLEEKLEKVQEDKIKRLPALNVNSNYQYNVNVGALTIPAGSFGSLPLGPNTVIALPNENFKYDIGTHHTFNASAVLYQPLTQQFKIGSAVKAAKLDAEVARLEADKVQLQVTNGVEKLYYGLLVNQYRQQEAGLKKQVAALKLYDVESALLAKKTVDNSAVGLRASLADANQELLKLQMEAEDYLADLQQLTGLDLSDKKLAPAAAVLTMEETTESAPKNVDVALAKLSIEKAAVGKKVAMQNNLPDVGVFVGYAYQLGSVLMPENNPFAGLSLKWDVQGILSNRHVAKQRELQMAQAAENVAYTEEQLAVNRGKNQRKTNQAMQLVEVAKQARTYRTEELKIQKDRAFAGLNKPIDVLEAEANFYKSEADYYAALLQLKVIHADYKLLE